MRIFSEHGHELQELIGNLDKDVREVMTLLAFARRYMNDDEDQDMYLKMQGVFLALENSRIELKECYEVGYIGKPKHGTRFFTMKDGEFQEVTRDEFPSWEDDTRTELF